ncbi:hypothetical protein JCM10914A_13110 [Paenibacillus sp. JCM 10914]|uniref:hypothetical protein n=1 Tax=Paenibacillus sp. JCM 10914 TaxID=1236974 RepID=UPI0003CC846A|nr:hypothetical protein [Paenibacillus sp. JCM 10914]GAE08617.1 hypothetical protein JCM10914_4922 [Paenibacillus sp. JCM 10914]
MARTRTQKALRKAERAGTWTDVLLRKTNADYGAMSQHVRVKPSKHEQLNKVKHRKRVGDDGAFFYWFCWM